MKLSGNVQVVAQDVSSLIRIDWKYDTLDFIHVFEALIYGRQSAMNGALATREGVEHGSDSSSVSQ